MPARDLPMRSQLVGPALAFVRRRGGDAGSLARAFGLSDGVDSEREAVLPLASLRAFFDEAARISGDPEFGLHLAAELPRGTWGVLEFSARSAPTVREAFGRIARYIGLCNEYVEITFRERDGRGSLQQRVPGHPLCLGRHANECWIASLLLLARGLTGSACVPERVWLAHPAPADPRALVALAGTKRVEFGAEANGIEAGAAFLGARVSSSDPPLLSLLEQYAARSLEERAAAPDGLVTLVREAIREQLRGDAPTLATTARALKTSSRTLQRQLASSGATFAGLVDEVRAELARVYVRDKKLAPGEVAYLLGYAETSAFLRAFRRWTGTTPVRFRAG